MTKRTPRIELSLTGVKSLFPRPPLCRAARKRVREGLAAKPGVVYITLSIGAGRRAAKTTRWHAITTTTTTRTPLYTYHYIYLTTRTYTYCATITKPNEKQKKNERDPHAVFGNGTRTRRRRPDPPGRNFRPGPRIRSFADPLLRPAPRSEPSPRPTKTFYKDFYAAEYVFAAPRARTSIYGPYFDPRSHSIARAVGTAKRTAERIARERNRRDPKARGRPPAKRSAPAGSGARGADTRVRSPRAPNRFLREIKNRNDRVRLSGTTGI